MFSRSMHSPHSIARSVAAAAVLALLPPGAPAVDSAHTASAHPGSAHPAPLALPPPIRVVAVSSANVEPLTSDCGPAAPGRADTLRRAREEPETIRKAKHIFGEEGVPEEFAWMAVVESSLNPAARSRAGAVGLYQLMPQTARELGLRVERRIDERYDAERNTRAAARYLLTLHNRFGSWRLALAAYNAGPTRVARLLRRHRARSYGDIAQGLPRRTREYVPKVFAAIAKHEGSGTVSAPRALALASSSQSAL